MTDYIGEFNQISDQDNYMYASYGQNDWIQYYISQYGYIDGAHHKQWLIDQVMRISMGTLVIVKEARWSDGRTEIRTRLGGPSKEYLDWIGDDIEDDEVIGIAP